jgi:hypothetical protein
VGKGLATFFPKSLGERRMSAGLLTLDNTDDFAMWRIFTAPAAARLGLKSTHEYPMRPQGRSGCPSYHGQAIH